MVPSSAASRVIALTLLAWVSLQRPAPPPPNSSQDYVISQEVDLVLLPVTVTNRQGEFVSGLAASNFRVYENGRPQTIADFQSEDTPVTVGLVVDHSGSMAAKSREVIEGAMAFLEASNPGDAEFVVNFSDQIMLGLPPNVAFTSDPSLLKAALANASASGRTALNDAVMAALRHLDSREAGKKVLILISDGGDNASRHTFAQTLQAAQAANVVIYTIGFFDENSADQNPKVLQALAKETGGIAYFPGTPADAVRVCRQIAGDIRHQYTLAYSPAGDLRGSYRKIRVNVSASDQKNLVVRSRAGYYWASKATAASSNSAGTAP